MENTTVNAFNDSTWREQFWIPLQLYHPDLPLWTMVWTTVEAEFKIVLVKDDECCKIHFVAILMYQISLIQNFMPKHLDKYN